MRVKLWTIALSNIYKCESLLKTNISKPCDVINSKRIISQTPWLKIVHEKKPFELPNGFF